MSTMINHRIVLASRPVGEAELANFRLEATEVPALQDGEVLVRHHYLSLDPYMRMRMNEAKSYAAPQALGQTMIGGTVGEVLQSRHDAYAPGEHVVGMGGWQELGAVDARSPGLLRKVDTTHIPLSACLGAVGMPLSVSYTHLDVYKRQTLRSRTSTASVCTCRRPLTMHWRPMSSPACWPRRRTTTWAACSCPVSSRWRPMPSLARPAWRWAVMPC